MLNAKLPTIITTKQFHKEATAAANAMGVVDIPIVIPSGYRFEDIIKTLTNSGNCFVVNMYQTGATTIHVDFRNISDNEISCTVYTTILFTAI